MTFDARFVLQEDFPKIHANQIRVFETKKALIAAITSIETAKLFRVPAYVCDCANTLRHHISEAIHAKKYISVKEALQNHATTKC